MTDTIHYFWEGGQKPRLVRRCVDSWKRIMPEAQIEEWNLARLEREKLPIKSTFYDQSLACQKWGFVIDVVRWVVLEKYGGIFLDADVEIIKPLPEGPWLAAEKDDPLIVNPGLGVSVPPHHPFVQAILQAYETLSFNPNDMLACASPYVISRFINRPDTPRILPSRVLNPLGWSGGRLGTLASDCCAIHWYAASWFNWKQRLVYKTLPRLGLDVGRILRWFRK